MITSYSTLLYPSNSRIYFWCWREKCARLDFGCRVQLQACLLSPADVFTLRRPESQSQCQIVRMTATGGLPTRTANECSAMIIPGQRAMGIRPATTFTLSSFVSFSFPSFLIVNIFECFHVTPFPFPSNIILILQIS